MSETIGIARAKTSEDDFMSLGTKSAFDVFREKLALKVLEFTTAHKPFDEQCARMDFRDIMETSGKESERKYGYVRAEDVKTVKFDLDKYGDKDRFEKIGDDVDRQDRVMEGMRTQVIIGHTIKYVCKRGHGVSVFLPNDVWEERFGEKKKETKV